MLVARGAIRKTPHTGGLVLRMETTFPFVTGGLTPARGVAWVPRATHIFTRPAPQCRAHIVAILFNTAIHLGLLCSPFFKGSTELKEQ